MGHLQVQSCRPGGDGEITVDLGGIQLVGDSREIDENRENRRILGGQQDRQLDDRRQEADRFGPQTALGELQQNQVLTRLFAQTDRCS